MHANSSHSKPRNFFLNHQSRDFWCGKKVFLTGHTGFKGAWLSLWLQSLGVELTGFSLPQPPTFPSLFELAQVEQLMHSVAGDIRDLASLQAAINEAQPDIVLHLAAQALVRDSYMSPVNTYATNVMGTVHVLEAVRKTPSVRVVLNITTDKCYENREWVWGYREDDRLGGHDPYANSKACAELVSAAYRDSFLAEQGIAVATARAGNVIGGGDWAKDRLIPDIIQSFMAERPVQLRNPYAIRPWQHVLEPLGGYLLLAQNLWEQPVAFTGAWNFGPEISDAWSVQRITEHLATLWGQGAAWTQDDNQNPHEAGILRLDSSKAREQLRWTPRLDIKDALRWIVEWTQGYQSEPNNLRKLTLSQIKRFEDLARLSDCSTVSNS